MVQILDNPNVIKWLHYQVAITKVTPAQPLEHTPICVRFSVKHTFNKLMSGMFEFVGRTDASIGPGSCRIEKLATGTQDWCEVWGYAPAAGKNVEIQVDFYDDDDAKYEFAPPSASATFQINVSANYEVHIDWVKCDNPRATYNDTLVGSCTLLFGGQIIPNPHPSSPFDQPKATQTASFGDHGANSTIPTSFAFGPISAIPGVSPDMTFNYTFLNWGYSGSKEESTVAAMNWLADVGKDVVTYLVPAGAAVWPELDNLLKQLHKSLWPNCDGPVASDNILMKSDVVERLTRGTGSYSETRHYVGTNSDAICGIVSNYDVKFSIVRSSFRANS